MATVNFSVSAKPVIAEKTLKAIDEAIRRDGGRTFRRILRQTISEASDAYRDEEDGVRSHLGASQIGNDCMRELWYTFRWAQPLVQIGTKNIPPSQMLRLLNRGHLEEARVIALLMMIGVQVWTHDANGDQYKFSFFGGHFGGAADGVVLGVPDAPEIYLYCEIKTHSDDSYTKLMGEGVRVSKPKHYVQMQMNMAGQGLSGAIYIGVNKNNDALHMELIEYNDIVAKERLNKAKLVIEAQRPPIKVNESPGWWMCKMCRSRFICHKLPDETNTIPTQARNCRTCVHSHADTTDGIWYCTQDTRLQQYGGAIPLSKEEQLAGCESYLPLEM